VPLRMPGRSGPANGREPSADENVPVPGAPLVRMKVLRELPSPSSDLDGTPTPRSLGGSDDEAAPTNWCGQERLPRWRPDLEAGT
jgi:hypothetical protein